MGMRPRVAGRGARVARRSQLFCAGFDAELTIRLDLDLLDLAERHLQEAGADRVEGIAVAGAEEAVGSLAVTLPREPGRLQRPLDRRRDGMPAADEADVAA